MVLVVTGMNAELPVLVLTEESAFGAPLKFPPPVISEDSRFSSDDLIATTIRPLLYRTYIASHILRLGTEARYSALVYLHRYAYATSQSKNATWKRPNKWVAAACLFLASKAEEEPRRLRDVINLAHMVLDDCNNGNVVDNGTEMDKIDRPILIQLKRDPPPLDEIYWDAKKRIVETEQHVLRWLGFDVFVPHPHRAVALLLQHLPLEDQELIGPVASRRLNDGLFHAPALRHQVLELACAAIELAQTELGQKVMSDKQGWWTRYGVHDERLRETMIHLEEATDVLKHMSPKAAETTTTTITTTTTST